MGIFCSSAKLLQLLNNFVVNIEDFKIEWKAIENNHQFCFKSQHLILSIA